MYLYKIAWFNFEIEINEDLEIALLDCGIIHWTWAGWECCLGVTWKAILIYEFDIL